MAKTRRLSNQYIPIDRCHLFGIKTPHALAKRLGWELNKLDRLAAYGGYRVYPHKKTGRMIQEPGAALQSIHRQIHRYLARVQAPSYLHSTIRGRSYVSNAQAHVGADSLVKIDIAKFYQSVPQHKVMHFFRDMLNCSPDVAGLLANLICFNGALATGSAASPIISYYAYKNLFDDIKNLADQNNLVMTCYVDDITISGAGVSGAILHQARTMIFQAGLRAHKACQFQPGEPMIVTGVIVGSTGIDLPFSRWKKIQTAVRDVERCNDPAERLEKYPALVSRLYEAAQINERCRPRALYHHERARALKRSMQAALAQTSVASTVAA